MVLFEHEEKEDQLLDLAAEVVKAGHASGLGSRERFGLFMALTKINANANKLGTTHYLSRLHSSNLNLQEDSINEILLHVEAVEMLLRAGSEGSEMAKTPEWGAIVATWIEKAALPILLSRRSDLDIVYKRVGIHIAPTLVSQNEPQASTAMEAATIKVLENICLRANTPGAEKDTSLLGRVGAQIGWVAVFLKGCARNQEYVLPLPVLERCLNIIRYCQVPVIRSILVREMAPALADVLESRERMEDMALHADMWNMIRDIYVLGRVEDERDAFAMLCVLQHALIPALSLGQADRGFWTMVRGGLSSSCSTVRKRALYILNVLVKHAQSAACYAGSEAGATVQAGAQTLLWWDRFVQVIDMFNTALETHLLNQTLPMCTSLLREAFGVSEEKEMAQDRSLHEDVGAPLPEPAFKWATLLLARAITVPNFAVQRIYLLWLMGEDGKKSVPLGKLGPEFIERHILPAFKEMSNFTEDRTKVGRFLALLVTSQAECEARREVLVAIFVFCKDSVQSALVRQTLLGFIEQDDVLPTFSPCLEAGDLELTCQMISAMESQYNHGLRQLFAELVIKCWEIFTDYLRLAAAGPNSAAILRNALLVIPVKASLGTCYERLVRFLEVIAEAGDFRMWWSETTMQASKALVLGNRARCDDQITLASSGSLGNKYWSAPEGSIWFSAEGLRCFESIHQTNISSCALACMFLPASAAAQTLSPVQHVLGRIQSHPYISLRCCLVSFLMVCNLGNFLRERDHPAVRETLRQHAGGTSEYLAGLLRESISISENHYGEGDRGRIFDVLVEVFGTFVWLAADNGQVANAVERLVQTFATTLRSSLNGGTCGGANNVQLMRTVALLQSILGALSWYPGSDIFILVRERWADALLRDLFAATAKLTSRADGRGLFLSLVLDDIWRSLALLHRMHSSHSNNDSYGASIPVEMDFFFAAIETASRNSLPDILYSMNHYLLSYLFPSQNTLTAQDIVQIRQKRLKTIVMLFLRCVEECNYRRRVAQLAIDMVFSPLVLKDPTFCRGVDNHVRYFLNRLIDLGTVKRGYLVLDATARLVSIWKSDFQAVSLAGEFSKELVELLVLRELPDDVYQQSIDEGREFDFFAGNLTTGVTKQQKREGQPCILLRILLLGCICDLFRMNNTSEAGQKEFLMSLMIRLFETAAAVDLRRAQILSSPDYSRKLRAWQAICVLIPFVDKEHVEAIQELIVTAMRTVAVPSVRFYQEIVLSYLCQKFPDVAIPFLMRNLSDLNVPPLTSASLVLSAGLACLTTNPVFVGGKLPQEYVGPLLQVILPWLSGQHANTRIVAQLLSFYLLSRLLGGDMDINTEALSNIGGNLPPGEKINYMYLSGTLRFLRDHREMAGLRQKTMLHFRKLSVAETCTLRYLLEQQRIMEGDSVSDLVPVHIETALRDAMTLLYRELEAKHFMTYTSMAPLTKGENLFDIDQNSITFERVVSADTGGAVSSNCSSFQKKISVSDVFSALLPSQPLIQSTNARGVQLQEFVMCASLLERVPNLAGLARTCEIFAVSKLVIPDMRLLRDPQFEKISSSAGRWIKIEEVHEGHTRAYIQRCKQEGYTIVGLEQTDDSFCLSGVVLPRKMVLLVGREKEGIPVPLLQELDLVVQIPQLGLVRSLNVHVSASLIVWEHYKQHRGQADAKE